MTQSQIAAEIGVSQMHVSRLLARTLAQLRESLAEGGTTEANRLDPVASARLWPSARSEAGWNRPASTTTPETASPTARQW